MFLILIVLLIADMEMASATIDYSACVSFVNSQTLAPLQVIGDEIHLKNDGSMEIKPSLNVNSFTKDGQEHIHITKPPMTQEQLNNLPDNLKKRIEESSRQWRAEFVFDKRTKLPKVCVL